ncbi:MAG: alpha/beta-type small acid-soluble spore protein [Bacillota bacterium]
MGQGQRTNQVLIPEARMALDQFKYEVAADLGINPPGDYWGNLTSRDCGAVGGHMVRRMIQLAEQSLAGRTGGTR